MKNLQSWRNLKVVSPPSANGAETLSPIYLITDYNIWRNPKIHNRVGITINIYTMKVSDSLFAEATELVAKMEDELSENNIAPEGCSFCGLGCSGIVG